MNSRASGSDVGFVLFLFVVAVSAQWCVASCRVSAQDTCAPEVTTNRNVPLEHGGRAGVWFDLRVANCLVDLARVDRIRSELVETLEQRLENEGLTLRTVERQAAAERQIALRAEGALDAAIRLREDAEEERDAWYRSPLLWIGVGAVVVVVLEAVAIWIWSEVTP